MHRNIIARIPSSMLVASLVALPVVGTVGCETSRNSVVADSNAGLDIEASSNSIVSGETVTLVARTYDTYGRDADVEWNTTAGDLKTEQSGRIARVTFDEIGTYTVSATLRVDGRDIARDMVEVRVRSIQ
jgi:hypothetical protein